MSSSRTEFRKYFQDREFIDRFAHDTERAVDVIIPVLHTNELWRANLLSTFREIPVKRLLLGDGGCIDDTIAIARAFPRVHVFDHRSFSSLGFSIRRLIEEVETDWFVYLHSDVFLPAGWFDAMCAGQDKYDWFECGQNVTVLVQYVSRTLEAQRAYSGSQMGRTAAFANVLPKVDDDFLYRNEDIIFAGLIKEAGFQYGKVRDVFYDHQVMLKESPWLRRVKRATFELELSRDEEIRAALTFVKGIVKYLKPEDDADLIGGLHENLHRLVELEAVDPGEFAQWVVETNPAWSTVFPLPNSPVDTAAPRVSPEPVVQTMYIPSRLARALVRALRVSDLTLRGMIGPGRKVRRWLLGESDDVRQSMIETRPTYFVIRVVRFIDRVVRGRSGLRPIKTFVQWRLFDGCTKLARSCERMAKLCAPR